MADIQYRCPDCEDVEWRSKTEDTFCFVCDIKGVHKYSSLDDRHYSAPAEILTVQSVPRPGLDRDTNDW